MRSLWIVVALSAACAEPTEDIVEVSAALGLAPAVTPPAGQTAAPAPPVARKEEPARLTVATGRVAPLEKGAVQAPASATHRGASHLVVAAPLPPDIEWVRWEAEVRGERHGVAAVSRERRLLVRLTGEKAPAQVVVDLYTSDHRGRAGRIEPWERRVVTLTGIGEAPVEDGLDSRFWSALADGLDSQGDRSPFFAFAAARARLLAGGSSPVAPAGRRPRSDLGDLMSLYTGMTSVEEALQADRGLRLDPEQWAGANVPLSDVTPVTLEQHPWDEMIAGRQPRIEPLARAVPDGMMYAHFHDLRTAVRMGREVEAWITPLAQLLEWRAGSAHVLQRYEEALMVERSGLAETLGHVAASGVALAVGDPFIREGTDVALVFAVKNETALKAALLRYEMAARKRHPQVGEARYTAGGQTVRRVSTRDGTVNQHRVQLGDVLVLANSRATIERFVAVHEGRAPALAEAGDFRYMRTIYPFDPAEEDGFLFIGDRFVERAVSPRTRILQARRMTAQADLASVGYAALMFGWLEGRPARGIEEVIDSGLLNEAELKHGDGSLITFDPATGASSVTWGRLAGMAPLAELTLTSVTPAEQAAYGRFREGYQRYWRAFIDPVAVRLRRSEDGRRLALDARMLPLIEATDYDDLIRMVGRTRVAPPELDGAVQWTVGIGEDASLRRELDGLGRLLGQDHVGFGWLGDWAMVGTRSSGALWDLAVAASEIPSAAKEGEPRYDDQALLEALNRAPLYAGVHVRNPLMLAATLTALRTFARNAAPGLVQWGEREAYREVPLVAVGGDVPGGDGRFEVYYATAADVFLVSTHRPTLEALIDSVLDGRAARPAVGADGAQAHLAIAPGGPSAWLTRTLLGLLETEARRQSQAALRHMQALARGLGGLPRGEERTRASLGYFGFEPMSVQGGSFVQADDRIEHDLYGWQAAPRVPVVPVPDAPSTGVLSALEDLTFGISFEGEGRTRALHVTVGLERR